MNSYRIAARTDAGEVSIITVAEQAHDSFNRPLGRPRFWHLVSTADGFDCLIQPGGTHTVGELTSDGYQADDGTVGAAARNVTEWLVANA